MTERNFDAAFATFLAGVKKISEDYMAKNFPNNPREEFTYTDGKRYVRVCHGGSAYCFVDKTNGDVLKPAGWKAPAKHARGNIFDEANGLATMGPYGPAYLR